MNNFKIKALPKYKQLKTFTFILCFFALIPSITILINVGLSFVSLIFPIIFSLVYWGIFSTYKGAESVNFKDGILSIYKAQKCFRFKEKDFIVQKYTVKSVEYGIKISSNESYVYLNYDDFSQKDRALIFGRINRLGNKSRKIEKHYGGTPDDEIDRNRYTKY